MSTAMHREPSLDVQVDGSTHRVVVVLSVDGETARVHNLLEEHAVRTVPTAMLSPLVNQWGSSHGY